mgnify:CR=1 FL=1
MENVSSVAIELGYLNIPDGYKISIDEMENFNNDEILYMFQHMHIKRN